MSKKKTVKKTEAKKPQPQDEADNLINIGDFFSLELAISIKNTTTRTEPPKGSRIQLVQLLDKGMVLEVPPRCFAKGHNLIVEVIAKKGAVEEFKFQATARADEIERIYDEADQTVITLLQFKEEEWAAFCERFASRQTEIETFFTAARGW